MIIRIYDLFYEENSFGCGSIPKIKLFFEPFTTSLEDDIR